MQGGTFAANLTRVGEKDNYDYLVRWVHNRASVRVLTVPTRKKTSVPKITKRRACPTSLNWTTAAARTTATSSKCRT